MQTAPKSKHDRALCIFDECAQGKTKRKHQECNYNLGLYMLKVWKYRMF